jgi:hypothetical protein
MKCTSYEAPHCAVFSDLLPLLLFSGPNILHSTLITNTRNLCASRGVRNKVSHSYKTTGKIIALYILFFKFREETRRQKTLNRIVASIPQMYSVLLDTIFICYCCSLILELCNIFKGFISNQYIVILYCILVAWYLHFCPVY